ncbi:hypothetical protein C8R44DRAFT_870790 [Mycena epipterygia]|nr:hypothetical protein C8R44DRAFT_870790 [Mycena epipterygia]
MELPPELISQIFRFLLLITLPLKADSPLSVLPQVCRSWNDLVAQSPELWASISVSFDDEGDVQRITSIAERWLARVGATHPLSIIAACTSSYAITLSQRPHLVPGFSVIDLVLSHTHRLKHTDIGFPISFLDPLLRLPSGSYPVFRVGGPAILFTFEERVALMADDNHRDVGIAHPAMRPSMCVPWARVNGISFTYSPFTPNTWCSILNECPRVQSAWLSIWGLHDEGPSVVRVHLNQLNFLAIAGALGGADDLLDRLVAPTLKGFCQTGQPISTATFLEFHTRSHFELEHITLGFSIVANDVELLLGPLADLKTFAFTPGMSADHFSASF